MLLETLYYKEQIAQKSSKKPVSPTPIQPGGIILLGNFGARDTVSCKKLLTYCTVGNTSTYPNVSKFHNGT